MSQDKNILFNILKYSLLICISFELTDFYSVYMILAIMIDVIQQTCMYTYYESKLDKNATKVNVLLSLK